jgi:hypothetical protein
LPLHCGKTSNQHCYILIHEHTPSRQDDNIPTPTVASPSSSRPFISAEAGCGRGLGATEHCSVCLRVQGAFSFPMLGCRSFPMLASSPSPCSPHSFPMLGCSSFPMLASISFSMLASISPHDLTLLRFVLFALSISYQSLLWQSIH